MNKSVIVEWSNLPPINSGALLQLQVKVTAAQVRLSAGVVAVSGAGHKLPHYAAACTAPVVYEDNNGTPGTARIDVELAWLEWLAARLKECGALDSAYNPRYRTKSERVDRMRHILQGLDLDAVPDAIRQ